MSFKFEIVIDIEANYYIDIPIKKSAYYQNQDGKNFWDRISFSQNKITISGNRAKNIDFENAFYTIRSTYYKDTLNALLYLYFSKGAFDLQSLTFNDKKIPLSQRGTDKFSKDLDFDINPVILEKLFEYGEHSEVLTKSLMLVMESQQSQQTKFNYLWRAFNAIYDFRFYEKKEVDKITKILDYVSGKTKNFLQSIVIAQDFICNYDEKQYKRFLRVANERTDYRHRNWESELTRFKDKYLSYSDKYVNGLVQKMLEDCFVKNEEKFDKGAKHVFKSINDELDKKLIKELPVDCLRYMIWYIYYFRNKYFHGEERLNSFLIENDADKELKLFSDLLLVLLNELINDDLFFKEV